MTKDSQLQANARHKAKLLESGAKQVAVMLGADDIERLNYIKANTLGGFNLSAFVREQLEKRYKSMR